MRAQPWMNRTRNQAEANTFDLDLHRLARRADQMAAAATPADRKKWDAASLAIHRVRVSVRSMMHEDDRAETS